MGPSAGRQQSARRCSEKGRRHAARAGELLRHVPRASGGDPAGGSSSLRTSEGIQGRVGTVLRKEEDGMSCGGVPDEDGGNVMVGKGGRGSGNLLFVGVIFCTERAN